LFSPSIPVLWMEMLPISRRSAMKPSRLAIELETFPRKHPESRKIEGAADFSAAEIPDEQLGSAAKGPSRLPRNRITHTSRHVPSAIGTLRPTLHFDSFQIGDIEFLYTHG